MEKPGTESRSSKAANWFGLNRSTVAVLVGIAGLGLSEEIWTHYFGVKIWKDLQHDTTRAVFFVSFKAVFVNLLEGFGYIIGGMLAHRMGARVTLALSALPMFVGFSIMLMSTDPWILVAGALLITNWEPLSVPATFEVVGSELPKDRRTIAFAMQSIQKRVPKMIGPKIGALAFAYAGYWLNLSLAFALVGVVILVQLALLSHMKAKPDPSPVPVREVLKNMPEDLRMLLTAEIFVRWGDWFVRDFAAIYVMIVLHQTPNMYGNLVGLTALVALLTYIPMGKLIDKAPTPKPYIGLTFIFFALFPFCMVLLPKTGMPLSVALAITFTVNGLREMGEPARKALITTGFPPEVRARAVGVYWGMRSFLFFPAPFVAYLLWKHTNPETTFLVGGGIGIIGAIWFWWRVKCIDTHKPTAVRS